MVAKHFGAMVSGAGNFVQSAAPGTVGLPVIDFSTNLGVENTMVAQGGTCIIAYNPNGWHDGTGCLEFTPTGAFPTIRALLSGNLPFQLNSDDGFGIEMMIPTPVDESQATGIYFILGTGGVAAGTVPANRVEWNIYYSNANAGSQKFEGTVYRRFRLDIANTDLKRGPVDGATAMQVMGTGLTKYSQINWWGMYTGTNFQNKTIKVKRITAGGRSRPQLVITLDNVTRYHQALFGPYMQSKGFRTSPQFMTQSWNSDAPNSQLGSYRQAELALWNAGGDMNANDIVDRPIAGVGYATMLAAARQMIADMRTYGFGGEDRGQRFWVYNNNSYDTPAVNALRDAGFIAGRAGSNEGRFTFTEGGVRNSMRLGSVSWDGATAQSMQDQITRAVEYGCTIHAYFHKIFPKAKLAADLPGATVPNAGETPLAYYNRVVGLNETATVNYLAARGHNDGLSSWWEDIVAMVDHASTLQLAGKLDVLTTSQWMKCHGLTKATP